MGYGVRKVYFVVKSQFIPFSPPVGAVGVLVKLLPPLCQLCLSTPQLLHALPIPIVTRGLSFVSELPGPQGKQDLLKRLHLPRWSVNDYGPVWEGAQTQTLAFR